MTRIYFRQELLARRLSQSFSIIHNTRMIRGTSSQPIRRNTNINTFVDLKMPLLFRYENQMRRFSSLRPEDGAEDEFESSLMNLLKDGISDDREDRTSYIAPNRKQSKAYHLDDAHERALKSKRKRTNMSTPKPTSNLVPKLNQPIQQTKANAQILFDYIAPHVSHETLLLLREQMQTFEQNIEKEMSMHQKNITQKKRGERNKRKKEEGDKRIIDYQTLLGVIDAYFSKPSTQKDVPATKMGKQKHSHGKMETYDLNSFPWVKSLLAQYFAGPVDTTTNSTVDGINLMTQFDATLSMTQLWRDETFPPNINRQTFDQDVSTFMLAREMCLESQLFWSNNQRRRQKFRRYAIVEENVDDDFGILKGKRDLHYQKNAQLLQKEAEAIVSLLAFRLPTDDYKRVIKLFEKFGTSVHSKISDNQVLLSMQHNSVDNGEEDQMEIMKMLYPNLRAKTGFHVHLIAAELADFFYVEIPNQNEDEVDPVVIKERESIETLKQRRIGKSDSRINEAWDEWNELRDSIVRLCLSAQHMFCRLNSASKKDDIGMTATQSDEEREPSDKTVELNEIPDESALEKIMSKYSKDNQERTEELLVRLDQLRTNEAGELVGHSMMENSRLGKPRKRANLHFDCYLLTKRFGPFGSFDTAMNADLEWFNNASSKLIDEEIAKVLPCTTKTIFVDNLPIDITEEELKYLYSRCGSVKNLKIFNLRPELDPGVLSERNVTLQRQKNRRTGGSKDAGENQLNRSPVYAMIEFQDHEGYETATKEILRIFGMIIRRQAARTFSARSKSKIYIENIPSGFYSMDMEVKISEALHPDMYLSLSLGQHVNSEPSSCTLTFPTFETAYYAYHKLGSVDFGSKECALHWMKTPSNAMGYWTREIIPEN